MSSAPGIPPGWYAGGVVGEERWWDGRAWTGYVRSVPVPRRGVIWLGDPGVSLAVGILCQVLAVFAGGATLLSLGTLMFLIPALAMVTFIALGALMLVNSAGLRRQRAQAAAIRRMPPR